MKLQEYEHLVPLSQEELIGIDGGLSLDLSLRLGYARDRLFSLGLNADFSNIKLNANLFGWGTEFEIISGV